MTDTLFITDMSPFGARLRLVSAFTGASLAEVPPPGGAGSEAMKAVSHFGKMPAIALDDRVLIESVPLMEYLVDKAGGSALVPISPEDRATMRGIMTAHDHHVLGAIWPMFLQLRTGKADPAIVVPAIEAGTAAYRTLIGLFVAQHSYALTEGITLADLAIAPFALLLGRINPMFGQPTPFVAEPRLADWWTAVSREPHVAPVLAVMDAALTRAFGQ